MTRPRGSSCRRICEADTGSMEVNGDRSMTTPARILVTGGYGCIGAPTVKWVLANSNAAVVAGSRDIKAWGHTLFSRSGT